MTNGERKILLIAGKELLNQAETGINKAYLNEIISALTAITMQEKITKEDKVPVHTIASTR